MNTWLRVPVRECVVSQASQNTHKQQNTTFIRSTPNANTQEKNKEMCVFVTYLGAFSLYDLKKNPGFEDAPTLLNMIFFLNGFESLVILFWPPKSVILILLTINITTYSNIDNF